jgi:hypothetical protein
MGGRSLKVGGDPTKAGSSETLYLVTSPGGSRGAIKSNGTFGMMGTFTFEPSRSGWEVRTFIALRVDIEAKKS